METKKTNQNQLFHSLEHFFDKRKDLNSNNSNTNKHIYLTRSKHSKMILNLLNKYIESERLFMNLELEKEDEDENIDLIDIKKDFFSFLNYLLFEKVDSSKSSIDELL